MSHKKTDNSESKRRSPGSEEPFLAFGADPDDRLYRLRLARYKAMAEAVRDYIRGHRSEHRGRFKLLDVGVGSGRSLRFLEAEGIADELEVHGLDRSTDRLEGLYSPERWDLVQGDATKGFPYERDSFDVFLCQHILEHLDDPFSVIRELGRVLRPGGLGILGVPIFPFGIAHLRRVLFREDRGLDWETSHVHTFTANSFLRLVRRERELELNTWRGFRIVSGGLVHWLENYHEWYRLNRAIGRLVPSLCTEIQVLVRGRSSTTPEKQVR